LKEQKNERANEFKKLIEGLQPAEPCKHPKNYLKKGVCKWPKEEFSFYNI